MNVTMTIVLDADDVAGGLPAALRKLAGEVTVSGGTSVVSVTLPEADILGAASAAASASTAPANVQSVLAGEQAVATATTALLAAAPTSLPIPAEASKILGMELDAAYTPWIEGIHNSNKKFYASGPNIGIWMLGRGIDREAAEPQLRARREQIKDALRAPVTQDFAMAPATPASTPNPAESLPPFAAASPATAVTHAADPVAAASLATPPFAAMPTQATLTTPLQEWTWPEFLQSMSRCGVTATQVQEASGLQRFPDLAADATARATTAAKLNMTKVQ